MHSRFFKGTKNQHVKYHFKGKMFTDRNWVQGFDYANEMFNAF